LKNARELLTKYKAGTCTAEEKMLIEKWLLFYHASETTDLTETDFGQMHKELWESVQQEISIKPAMLPLWPKVAAAMGLVILSIGVYWFTAKKEAFNQGVVVVNDVAPGKNKAYLTLANGKRIELTDAANGKLVEEAGVQITKTADGQLVYEISPDPGGKRSSGFNSIETPRGGQYQINLPDGTRVWLNAASKLVYPLSFAPKGNRKVRLSGEAYFEVARDETCPFLVESIGQTVKVLGTHFNINSYADEGEIKTTLLEGSVKVESNDPGTILKPGEQASFKNNKIKVTQVNPENAIAWKNGEFEFSNESLESIMRKISRWYDVDVIYQDQDLKNEIFSGGISRFEQVSDVLKKLSLTEGARFKIEGRRIFVMK